MHYMNIHIYKIYDTLHVLYILYPLKLSVLLHLWIISLEMKLNSVCSQMPNTQTDCRSSVHNDTKNILDSLEAT